MVDAMIARRIVDRRSMFFCHGRCIYTTPQMNPWNAFVRQHRGQGLTMKQLARMYQAQKGDAARALLDSVDDKLDRMHDHAQRIHDVAKQIRQKEQKPRTSRGRVDELQRQLRECEAKLRACAADKQNNQNKRPPVARTTTSSSRKTSWSDM